MCAKNESKSTAETRGSACEYELEVHKSKVPDHLGG
jgi:hypothetical protein